MKIVCDTPNNKNKIGKEILEAVQSSITSSFIVSPYISNLSDLIDLSKIEELQIICNAESSSCNPYTLLDLLKSKKIKIKSRNDIHAKIYIFDEIAFITSANATNNGLSIGTIEAAVKLEDEQSIKEIKKWFIDIWSDNQSIDISTFCQSKWEKIKSQWNLSNNQKRNQSLYDLIISKRIPDNTSFVLWHDIKEAPDKMLVAKKAKDENIIELPKNSENWDYWIEDEAYSKKDTNLEDLEELLARYYNHTIVNLKTHANTKRVYNTGCFLSKLLDKPIILKWKSKTLLLSLYRTDNMNSGFVIDKKTIALLNLSRDKNKKIWKQYLNSNDSKFGFCSTEQLYKLVKDCSLA